MVGPQPCPNLQAYRRQNTTAGSTTAFSRLSLQRLDFCLGFKCVSPGPGSRSPLSAFLVVTPWSPLLFGSVLLPIKTCTLPFGYGSPEGLPDHRLRTVPPISVRSRTLDHNPLPVSCPPAHANDLDSECRRHQYGADLGWCVSDDIWDARILPYHVWEHPCSSLPLLVQFSFLLMVAAGDSSTWLKSLCPAIHPGDAE